MKYLLKKNENKNAINNCMEFETHIFIIHLIHTIKIFMNTVFIDKRLLFSQSGTFKYIFGNFHYNTKQLFHF